MIAVTCNQCGLRILVPESVRGARGVCFGCGAAVRVPEDGTNTLVGEPILSFEAGARIGDRYEIRGLTGKGGMGAVYSAHDHLIGEAVALKFMNPRLLRTQQGQQLFIQEAQIARRLRHENIVAVHDVSRTPEGILYLSMEYLQGQSLRSYLRGRRKEYKLLDVRFAVQATAQILAALAYAHRYVVHRDVKPENMMLLSGERIKVLDFGLAKALDTEAEILESKVKDGRIIGTSAYASPEQKQHHPIDFRADLYSVGLVFYELLTLRTPLDKYVAITRVRDDVSPSLLEVYERAIREEPESRWQSAAAFREALLAAYRGSYEHAPAAAQSEVTGRVASTEGMLYLEGGSFVMGSNDAPAEAPEHEAHVGPFYIDRTPVTVAQYREFLEDTDHPKPKFWGEAKYGGDNQPIVGVTWEDASAYARWAGKRLPTEAQWEFAARGRENRQYPWGSLDPDPTRANYDDNLSMPSIVGMHEDGATPDGLQDLAGNVYEWTRDWYVTYAERTQHGEDWTPDSPRKAARGGSWQSKASELRCSRRKGYFLESREPTLGFRCVVEVDPQLSAED